MWRTRRRRSCWQSSPTRLDNMDQKGIARINALAKKAKTEGLTEAELAERDALRRGYIESVRANLRAQLDNTFLVDEQGNKRPLPRRDKKGGNQA